MKGKTSEIAEKIKALVCPDGTCPGALLDVEVPHGADETADQIKAKIAAYLGYYLKKGVFVSSNTPGTELSMKTPPPPKAAYVVATIEIAATTSSISNSWPPTGRRLTASDTAITTVRFEFDTNADSTTAAANVNAFKGMHSGVTTSTIPVTATDFTAAAAAVVPTAVLSATAVAAALYSLC